MKIKIVFLTLLTFGFLLARGEEKTYNTVRDIELKCKDSTVTAGIIISAKQYKIEKGKFYYWYHDGNIYVNQQGAAGFLLQGPYKVFDKAGRMFCSGTFEHGLKNGLWCYWYPNGCLKRTESYNLGILSGKVVNYDTNGVKIVPAKKSFAFFRRKNNDTAHADSLKIKEVPQQDTAKSTKEKKHWFWFKKKNPDSK